MTIPLRFCAAVALVVSTAGAASAHENLGPAEVDAAIRKHLVPIRRCYERALPKKPDLEGRIVVHFTVTADGSVTDARIGSTTLNDAEVERCVTDRIARIRFPAPRGGGNAVVDYPFLFRAGE